MSKNEARMRKLLSKLAAKSDHPRSHHAAVVVKAGKIISTGTNRDLVHAEQEALLPEGWVQPRGAVLYTMMFRAKTGTVGDGTPCPDCMRSIISAGIRKVVVYI